MTARLTVKNFISRSQLVHNNYDYSDVVYINARTKVIIKCSIHGAFKQTPDAHLHGQGCPDCKNKKIGDRLRFDNQYLDKFLKTNNIKIKRLGNYINSGTHLQFECLNCDHRWNTSPDHIFYERTGCPHCSKFKNEKIVGNWLTKHNIVWTRMQIEIDGKKYYPDYFISSLNMVIEYNGDQHYRPVCFKGMSLEVAINNFEKQLVRDSIIRKYCESNSLFLLEIDGRKYKNNKLEFFLHKHFLGDQND